MRGKLKWVFLSLILLILVIALMPTQSSVDSSQASQSVAHRDTNTPPVDSSDRPVLKVEGELNKASTQISVDENFDCAPEITTRDIREYAQLAAAHLASLVHSNSPDGSSNYALFADDLTDENRKDLLLTYQETHELQPLAAHELIRLCTLTNDSNCTAELIYELASVDDNNGATWLAVLAFFIKQEDEENALIVADLIDKTSLFNERFGERVLAYTQFMEGAFANHFTSDAITGVGKASQMFSEYARLYQWCRNSLASMERQEYCLLIGEQLTSRSKQTIHKSMGLDLQKLIYEIHDDQQMLRQIETTQQQLQVESVFNDSKNVELFHTLVVHNEDLLRNYLSDIDVYGEQQSKKQAIEDAIELAKNDKHYRCKLARETFEALH